MDKIIELFEQMLESARSELSNLSEIPYRNGLHQGVLTEALISFDMDKLTITNCDITLQMTYKGDFSIPTLREKLSIMLDKYESDPLLSHKFTIYLSVNGNALLLLEKRFNPKMDKLISAVKSESQKIVNGEMPEKDYLYSFVKAIFDMEIIDIIGADKIVKIASILAKHKDKDINYRWYVVEGYKQFIDSFIAPYSGINVQKGKYMLKVTYKVIDNRTIDKKDEKYLDLVIAGMVLLKKEDYAEKYIENIKKLKIKKVDTVLKNGSALHPNFEDSFVKCKNNDITGVIKIEILEENQNAYKKAIEYILSLDNFPTTYKIDFKSGVKKFLPIKKIGKSKTQNFFANALDYKETYPLLEKYAESRLGDEYEFAWYDDIYDEFCCKPGTYAVFGLALASEEYFPLFRRYLESIDREHQGLQNEFIKAFMQKYQYTAETLNILLSFVQFEGFKLSDYKKDLSKPMVKKLLDEYLETVEKGEKSYILREIYGDNISK